MDRSALRAGGSRTSFIAWMLLAGLASPAWAGIIATDNYQIGSGAYTAGVALKSEPGVPATGFQSTGYTSGSGTSNFIVNAGGLAATDPSNAGQVNYTGYGADNAIRSVARLMNPVASTGTYWFSINVSQDGSSIPVAGTTNGYALAGFGNTTPPVLGNTTTTGVAGATSSYLQGLFFGFAHEPTDPSGDNADLVIRYRNTTGYTAGDSVLLTNAAANSTYTIIARLDVNVGGGSADNLTYWVNPTNTSSQAALDSSSLVNNDGSPAVTYAFQTSADFVRLTYSAQDWNGDARSANFSDPTLGTTLADVVPTAVPEPASIAMMAMGMLGGIGMLIRRRRPSA